MLFKMTTEILDSFQHKYSKFTKAKKNQITIARLLKYVFKKYSQSLKKKKICQNKTVEMKICQKTDEKTKFLSIPDLEKMDSEEIELTLNQITIKNGVLRT